MPVSLCPNLEPIPGYRLIERLGRGGFGEVWKAEAPGGLHKAIKFVYGDLDATDSSEPADQEYKSLERIKSIRHPYILSLERIDVVDGQLLIVMELADRNLWDRFRDCRTKGLPGIPREELLGYLREAAEALDLMNFQHQLQHLDIKPQNLFLVYNHIKVADFGLVKAFEGKRGTITGGVTPVYAAPETFDGWVSRHSDQYSLAIVFQELLTGQRPFNGTSARQLLLQHLQAKPDLSSLPDADREIVSKSLSKKPDDRFDSSAEFVKALMNPASISVKSVPAVPKSAVIPPPAQTQAHSIGRMLTPAATPARFVQEPLSTIPPPASSTRVTQTHARLQAPLTRHHKALEVLDLPEPPATRESLENEGVIVPTFIIGLGGAANQVLTAFRGHVRKQFGSEPLPHLRLLAVDTDPEAIRALTTRRKNPLRADEVFHAALNRPSYYLKGEGPAGIDTWLGSSTLYQLPKNPGPAELRAFGRLALMDHAATLARRVRAEIDACRQPSSLTTSNERTNLGIRSQRPRVFVIAGLGGGTGGGMFLDVGYLAKAVLRQLGDIQPEVIGVGLLPQMPRKGSKANQAVAQTHATLVELMHYCSDDTSYDTRFGDANKSVGDREPPFARCAMFPLGDVDSKSQHEMSLRFVGHWLGFESLSYIGRVAELWRTEHADSRQALNTVTASEFVFEYPRDELCESAGRRCGLKLIRSWLLKRESPEALSRISQSLDELWESQKLSPDGILQRIHEIICESLGGPPADKIENEIGALVSIVTKGQSIEPADVLLAVKKMVQLVGAPDGFVTDTANGGQVAITLEKEAARISEETEQLVSDVIVQLVERPGIRISGAEEAIQMVAANVQKSLGVYESLAETLKTEAEEIGKKFFPMISNADRFALTAKRRDNYYLEMLGHLRELSKKLYQRHLAIALKQLYRSVFSSVPEYLREVQYCRERLNQAEKLLTSRVKVDQSTGEHKGLNLLPFNAANINECAEIIVEQQAEAGLLEFDNCVQKDVVRLFESLIGFCLNSGPRPDQLQTLLESTGATYIAQHLPENDSVTTLLQRGSDSEELQALLSDAMDAALPPLVTPGTALDSMVTVVGVPDTSSGLELQSRIENVKFRAPIQVATHRRNVVIYRELQELKIRDLPHLGVAGQENYQQLISELQLPAHSRIDIQWQSFRS